MSNKLITNSDDPQTLKVVYGNDFTLHVFFTKYNVETKSWEYYDMSSARNLNFYLVSTQFKRIKLQHTMQSDGSLIVNVISTYLQNTTYGVECQWDTNGKNRRTYTPILIQIVNTTPEADVDFSEYEANNAYDLNIRIVSDIDVIRIGGVSNIPEGDIVTLSYLESNYYDKDAIDDNYYDKNETDHLLTYYVNDSDLETLLNAFEAEIEGEFIDHTELDEALGYFTTTDDLTTYYATKAYVNAAIAAIPATDLSNLVDLTSYQHISGEKSFENKVWIVNRENAQWHVDNIGGEIAYAGKFSRMTGNQLFIGEVIAPHQNAAYNTSNVNNTKDEIVFEKVTSTSDYKAPTFSQMAKITSDGIYEGNTALRDKYTSYSYIDSKGYLSRNELNTLGYMTQSDISAMSYSTTNYVDTKVASIDIPDVSGLVSQTSLESQLSNYVTNTQLNSASYATTSQLESATSDMATKTYVQSKVNDIVIPDVSDFVTYEFLNSQSYAKISDIPDVSNFVTSAQLSSASYATETYVTNAINAIPGVDLTGFATESYVVEKINDIDLSSYVTHNELDSMSYVVHDELAGFATQAYVATKVDGLCSYDAISAMSYLTTGDAYDLYATRSYVLEHVDGLVSYTALEDMSYISTEDLDIETVVTTDTEQEITGPKTFYSESTFNNLNYNLQYNDNADGVAKTSMFARSSMNQAIIGQIIAPSTSYTDNLQSIHNTAHEIVFERISSVDATAPTLVQMAKITSGGIVENGDYLSSKYTSYAYLDARLSAIDTSNYVSYDFLSSQSYVTSNDLSNYATQSYVDTKVDGLASYAAINEMSYVQQSSLDTTLLGYVTTTTAQTIPVTKTFNYGVSSLTDIAGQEQRSITVGRSVTNQTITGQIIAPLVSASDGTGGVNIQNEIVCYAAPNGTTLQMTQLGKFTTQGIYEGTQKLSDKYATFNYVDQAVNSVRANGVMLASNSPVNASYIWTGTNAQLRNIQVRDPNTLYITTDDEAQQIDLQPYLTKSDAATYYTTYAYVESRTPAIVVCTQAEYNSYVSGGTVNASTIYMIKEQ